MQKETKSKKINFSIFEFFLKNKKFKYTSSMHVAICFKEATNSEDLGTCSPFSLSPFIGNKGSSNSGFPSEVTLIEIT